MAERFETHRTAWRRWRSASSARESEAGDAVQEAWLRFSRSDPRTVENLGGWLTTVVARICLDMLPRAEISPRGVPMATLSSDGRAAHPSGGSGARTHAPPTLSGWRLMVVLDRLAPAERVAFVLHDLFDVSFDDIARIVDRSPVAARQLASRARRRVQGAGRSADDQEGADRRLVEAFLAASRQGDLAGLLTILDPEVVFRRGRRRGEAGDGARAARGRGGGRLFRGRAQAATVVLIDGAVGIRVAPAGRLLLVLRPTIVDGRIVAIEAVADRDGLTDLIIDELPA